MQGNFYLTHFTRADNSILHTVTVVTDEHDGEAEIYSTPNAELAQTICDGINHIITAAAEGERKLAAPPDPGPDDDDMPAPESLVVIRERHADACQELLRIHTVNCDTDCKTDLDTGSIENLCDLGQHCQREFDRATTLLSATALAATKAIPAA